MDDLSNRRSSGSFVPFHPATPALPPGAPLNSWHWVLATAMLHRGGWRGGPDWYQAPHEHQAPYEHHELASATGLPRRRWRGWRARRTAITEVTAEATAQAM